MKSKKKILALIPLLFLLGACSPMFNMGEPVGDNHGGKPIDDAGEHTPDSGIDEDETSGGEIEVIVPEDDDDEDEGEGTGTGGGSEGEGGGTGGGEAQQEDGSTYTEIKEGISYDDTNKLFTITLAGEYIFKGEFSGNILVNADKDADVKITLSGFTIRSNKDAPIKCDLANELQISLKKDTVNYIYDNRATKTVDDDTQGNGAITSSCDMKVTGKGSLCITAKYNNGIHCKDDLTLKSEVNNSSSIQINAYNNALRGNDSVEIKSGNLVLISTNGNGIMTEATDLSDKGNQRGTVTISGGQVDIYSAKDGIDAAYNVEISGIDEETQPIVNIYTSKYSEYSNEVTETSTSKLYLKFSDSINTSSYYYAVEFLNSNYVVNWKKATKLTTSGGGGYSRSTYFEVSVPSDATSFKVCSFANSVTTMSEDNAYAKMSSFQSLNSYYDTIKLSISGTTIYSNGWTNYSSGGGGQPGGGPGGQPGGMEEGNDDKAEVSAKGIKAENEINISLGKIFIKAYDDAIHTNYGEAFENGATGLGNVNISGGSFDLYASDDGIHADHELKITGGTIDIKYSYEGIEGNVINISGGYTKVYSIDDALNAANKSGVTPSITVSGGILDVTVYGQDVDGIDSNGSFTQTGGYVITKGGNSQMSTGLDVDGTCKVTGGTFVAFGRTEVTPSTSNGVTSYSLSGSYSIGTYNIVFADSTSVTVTTKYSYSIIYVYSDTSTKITVTKA